MCSTKHCLRKILGRAKFSNDEFLTALAEIEIVFNSKPLTYISTDDLDKPITPSHFLAESRPMSYPDHLLTNNYGLDGDPLTHSLDSFGRRWRREYLLELYEMQHNHHSSGKLQLVEGHIAVVYSDNQPHSC